MKTVEIEYVTCKLVEENEFKIKNNIDIKTNKNIVRKEYYRLILFRNIVF